MKLFLFKYSVPMVYFLSATVFVLVIAASLLYVQKTKVQAHNRLLILQNDSILSEHLRLKNSSLQQMISRPDKETKLSSVTIAQ